VPVDCRVLIAGLGALHCLTQQVPAVPTRGQWVVDFERRYCGARRDFL